MFSYIPIFTQRSPNPRLAVHICTQFLVAVSQYALASNTGWIGWSHKLPCNASNILSRLSCIFKDL